MIVKFAGENLELVSQKIFDILSTVYSVSPWSQSQILSELTKPENETYLAYENGELVGFLTANDMTIEKEITNLAVRTDKQQQGFARALFQEFSYEFSGEIFLEVRESNLPAISLYESLGFVEFYRRKKYYINPVEDALLMRISLGNEEIENG